MIVCQWCFFRVILKNISAIGDWRLAIGDWRLAIGDWRLDLALRGFFDR